VTDANTGETTIAFRVTNKCSNAVGYVAIGTDGFTRLAPARDSVYTGTLGSYAVSWANTSGNPGFTSVKFQPQFSTFKSGASDVFSVVVANFNPNTTIQVAGHAGTAADETASFLLGRTTCPTPTPTSTSTPKPTKTPKASSVVSTGNTSEEIVGTRDTTSAGASDLLAGPLAWIRSWLGRG